MAAIIMLALVVFILAGIWKAFTKAGKPGWASIIPIYNIIVLLEIARKPLWWIVLFLIPIVSIVVAIIVYIEVAKNFGKGAGFGIGLALLGPIFWPILGFGDAQYIAQAQGAYPQGPPGGYPPQNPGGYPPQNPGASPPAGPTA